MTILINATIKYKGYDPDTLSKGSRKRICCACNECGKVRYVEFRQYRDLCHYCSVRNKTFSNEHKTNLSKSKLGNKNPNYIKIDINLISKEYQNGMTSVELSKKYNCSMSTIIRHLVNYDVKIRSRSEVAMGIKNSQWKGGICGNRDHLISINQCIKLNIKFPNSDAHHVMSNIIIYLPHKLHNSIWHDLKNNRKMKEINKLALNYLENKL